MIGGTRLSVVFAARAISSRVAFQRPWSRAARTSLHPLHLLRFEIRVHPEHLDLSDGFVGHVTIDAHHHRFPESIASCAL